MSVAPQQMQTTSGVPSETVGLVIVLAILVGLSAFPVTAKAAFWITFFLLCVVLLSFFQSSQAKLIGQELASIGKGSQ